jgi:hypothetical protein
VAEQEHGVVSEVAAAGDAFADEGAADAAALVRGQDGERGELHGAQALRLPFQGYRREPDMPDDFAVELGYERQRQVAVTA